MGKWILVEPLDDDVVWLEHSIPLHPREELGINVQVLIRVAQHHDARSFGAFWHGNANHVAKRSWGEPSW